MIQNKFISINAILGYVPEPIREEAGDVNLVSWAFQALRHQVPEKFQLKEEMLVLEIVNHKVKLPQGVRRVTGVWYLESLAELSDVSEFHSAKDITVKPDNSNRDSFLRERTVHKESLQNLRQPVKYAGQNDLYVNNDYLDYYDDCGMFFTLDDQISCINIDSKTGYAIVTYRTFRKNNEYLIPDDTELLRALGLHAEAEAWRLRSARKEQGAEQMYDKRMTEAKQYFISNHGRNVLRAFDHDRYEMEMMNQIQYHPVLSSQGKNLKHYTQ